MGMTIVEKILAKKSGKDEVKPGENIWVNVDVLMTHDVTGPGSMAIFKKKKRVSSVNFILQAYIVIFLEILKNWKEKELIKSFLQQNHTKTLKGQA